MINNVGNQAAGGLAGAVNSADLNRMADTMNQALGMQMEMAIMQTQFDMQRQMISTMSNSLRRAIQDARVTGQ